MDKAIIIKTMKIGLIAIFIIILVYAYLNKDVLFRKVVVITHPDNCTEIYENGFLTTEKCKHVWTQGDTDWLMDITNKLMSNLTLNVSNLTNR